MPREKDITNMVFQIIVAFALAILIFNLGVFTGIFYLIAVIGAIRNGLFSKNKNMASHLFGGTILIYCAGLIAPMIFNFAKSGEWISAILVAVLALYFWLKGYIKRKLGIDID